MAESPDRSVPTQRQQPVLEGYLWKRGSRSQQFWHERYFVLNHDNTLAYYQKKDDLLNSSQRQQPPKACYTLNELPDCEISDVYADRHNKDMIYCIKIAWSPPDADTSLINPNDSFVFSDASSIQLLENLGGVDGGGGGGASLGQSHQSLSSEQNNDSRRLLQLTPQRSKGSSSKSSSKLFDRTNGFVPFASLKKPKLRKSKSEVGAGGATAMHERNHSSGHNIPGGVTGASSGINNNGSFSLDGGADNSFSSSLGTGSLQQNHHQHRHQQSQRTGGGGLLRRRHNKAKSYCASANNASSSMPASSQGQLEIPSLVEVENHSQRHLQQQLSASAIATPTQQHPLLRQDSGRGPADQESKLTESSNATAQMHNRSMPMGAMTVPYKSQNQKEMDVLRSRYLSTKKQQQKKAKQKIVQSTKIAAAAGAAVGVALVTAGIGLIAGVVVLGVGAAAGGGGAVVTAAWKGKKEGEIIIACSSYEQAKMWKAALDASLESQALHQSRWGQLFTSHGRSTRVAILPHNDDLANTLYEHQGGHGIGTMHSDAGGNEFDNVFQLEAQVNWRPLESGWALLDRQGLRIFLEEREQQQRLASLSAEVPPCAPLKSHIVLQTSALDAFLCTMSYGNMEQGDNVVALNSGQRASFRVLEIIDDHTDVIHLVFQQLYLFPSWTSPRDFVLYRYWRHEPDGSYIICYDSIQHKNCPPNMIDDYVRGEMHQVITIAPQKKSHSHTRNNQVKPSFLPHQQHHRNECLIASLVQVNPMGWVPVTSLPCFSGQSYGDAFGVAALLQLLDIRDAIDQDRFVQMSLEENSSHRRRHASYYESKSGFSSLERMRSLDSADETVNDDPMNYDFAYATNESTSFGDAGQETDFARYPPQTPKKFWAAPNSNSFRVRGKHYKVDKNKFNAGPSIGRLIAVDVVWVDEPIYSGFSAHPTERIQLALQREKAGKRDSGLPPFVFVVNICIPGPPYYHAVFYYGVDDLSTIDGSDGTPSSLLCREFLFGESDEFRDKTFKLIPQIVQGSFIVKNAVGTTPAIMGKKLRQLYVKGERFFEVVLDCGSSSVATGVIRLSLGYAKTLVVDMGFLLEGDDEEHLPERIFGCVRCKQVEFGPFLRKVLRPPDAPLNAVSTVLYA